VKDSDLLLKKLLVM